MNNGNVNNNNKSNNNYVRAVSEFQGKFGQPVVSLEDMIKAYYLCRNNKRGTLNALSFEINALPNCYKLWEEVNNGAYTIGKSICFIVEYPVKREVFAGEFRDRVIQTYLVMKLEPILEDYLPADMDINKVTATINSYYGLFGQYHSYNIRKQYASIILDKWGEKLYFTNDFKNVKIKKKFTDKWKNIERVRRMRRINYNRGGATLP